MTHNAYTYLLQAIDRRAHVPELATDEGCGFTDEAGSSVPCIAAPPLAETVISNAEAQLGHVLPKLLKTMYMKIGNGGFGPGYGLLPLIPATESPASHTVVELYVDMKNALGGWPEHLVPFAHWGGGTLSCVDVRELTDPPVIRFAPGVTEAWTRRMLKGRLYIGVGLLPECNQLSQWFQHWLDSKPNTGPAAG